LIDRVDELIISALSQNSKQEVFEIWDFLKGFNYNLTEEEIESRISKLEEEGIIKGYT
jgi:DNA-binding Lrp family transcriptional regulator